MLKYFSAIFILSSAIHIEASLFNVGLDSHSLLTTTQPKHEMMPLKKVPHKKIKKLPRRTNKRQEKKPQKKIPFKEGSLTKTCQINQELYNLIFSEKIEDQLIALSDEKNSVKEELAPEINKEALFQNLEKQAFLLEKDPKTKNKALQIYFYLIKERPSQCDYYFRIGAIYHSMGLIELSQQFLLKSLELCPDNLPAIEILNEIHKNIDCSIDPKKIEKLLNTLESIGNVYERESINHEKALKIYQFLYHQEPENCNYSFNLGKIYFLLKNYEESKKYLIKTLESCPFNESAIYVLNEIIEVQKSSVPPPKQDPIALYTKLETFAKSLEKNEDTREQAILVYKVLLCFHPQNCDYLFYLGKLYYSLKRFDEAEVYLMQALEICPEYLDIIEIINAIHAKRCCPNSRQNKISSEVILRLESQGKSFLDSKNFKDALEIYLFLNNLKPRTCDYNLQLGNIYHALQNREASKFYLLKAIEFCQNFNDALPLIISVNDDSLKDFKEISHEEKSLLKRKLEEYSLELETNKEKNKALEIRKLLLYLDDPMDCDQLFSIGKLLHSMGRNKESLKYLFILLQRCPDNIDAVKLINEIQKKKNPLKKIPLNKNKKKLISTFETLADQLSKNKKTWEKAACYYELLISLDSLNCDYYYSLGKLQKQLKMNSEAKENLQKALLLCPNDTDALELLATIKLPIDDLSEKQEENKTKTPKDNSEFLERFAKIFHLKKETRHLSSAIYEQLILLDPKNCDYLFLLATDYHSLNEDEKAIAYLKKCLLICPKYYDAVELLGRIYIKKKKYKAASLLYKKYFYRPQSKHALAEIAFLKGNFIRTEQLFNELLCHKPNQYEYLIGFARALYNRRYYFTGKPFFLKAMNKKCSSKLITEYVNEVKPFTNPTIIPEFSYTKAKENDPSIHQPVVRDIYVTANLNIFYPFNDYFHLSAKTIFYNQKEIDIHDPKGLNYDAFIVGGQLKTHARLCSYWYWDLGLRCIEASGRKKAFFPFHQTSNFEPSCYVFYKGYKHFFSVGGDYESFVIKNFSKQISQIQRFSYIELRYGYKVRNGFFEPNIQGWVSRSFYQDSLHNRKNLLAFFTTTPIPFFNQNFRIDWYAEYSGFDKLSRNYTSYKRQWKNVLGITYRHDFNPCSYVEFAYEEKWQSSKDIFMPVGDTVFISPSLFIRGYKPIIRFGYRYRDNFSITIGGHYYRDTFPYKDYNVNTTLLWYF